jgi:hypothetical protein
MVRNLTHHWKLWASIEDLQFDGAPQRPLLHDGSRGSGHNAELRHWFISLLQDVRFIVDVEQKIVWQPIARDRGTQDSEGANRAGAIEYNLHEKNGPHFRALSEKNNSMNRFEKYTTTASSADFDVWGSNLCMNHRNLATVYSCSSLAGPLRP